MSKRRAVGTQHIPVSVARQGTLSSHACAKPGAMRARGRVRTSDGRQVVHDNFFHDDSHDDVHDCMPSFAAPPRYPCGGGGAVPGWLESAHNPCGFAQCAFRPKSPSWKDLTSASMLSMARKSNRILRFLHLHATLAGGVPIRVAYSGKLRNFDVACRLGQARGCRGATCRTLPHGCPVGEAVLTMIMIHDPVHGTNPSRLSAQGELRIRSHEHSECDGRCARFPNLGGASGAVGPSWRGSSRSNSPATIEV